MEITSIRTEKDYKLALQRIDTLMDAKPNTKEFDELNSLVSLVEVYEEKHYKIDAPSPIFM